MWTMSVLIEFKLKTRTYIVGTWTSSSTPTVHSQSKHLQIYVCNTGGKRMRRSSQQQIMKVLWWQLLNTPNQKENKPTLRWCSFRRLPQDGKWPWNWWPAMSYEKIHKFYMTHSDCIDKNEVRDYVLPPNPLR